MKYTLPITAVLIGLLALIALTQGCGSYLIEEVASMPNEPEPCYEAVGACESNETVEDEEIIVRDVKVPLTAEEETYEAPDEIQVETFEEIYDEIPEITEEPDDNNDAENNGAGTGEDVGNMAEDVQPNKHLWGVATITHYCSCSACAGQWAGGPTASGVMPTPNHTVACELPFGTRLEINGQEYVVEDRGVSGMWVDIYCSSHDEALARGMYSADVYIIDE